MGRGSSTSSPSFFNEEAGREVPSSASTNRTQMANANAQNVLASDDGVLPPYTRYPSELPRQIQPQAQYRSQSQSPSPSQPQTQTQSQSQRTCQSTQYQPAAQREYQDPQYQPIAQRQAPAQSAEYRYQMDLPQDYNGSYGYGRRGRRGMRREMGGGLLHRRRMGGGLLGVLTEPRQQGSQQPGYGYDDGTDYGRGRRGLRRRDGGGGLIHMLVDQASKRF